MLQQERGQASFDRWSVANSSRRSGVVCFLRGNFRLLHVWCVSCAAARCPGRQGTLGVSRTFVTQAHDVENGELQYADQGVGADPVWQLIMYSRSPHWSFLIVRLRLVKEE